jgi:seryl-tRNA synthetase
MIPLRFIREHADLVRESLAARADDAPLDELLRADERRRELLQDVEALRAERNALSKRIGAAADGADRQELIAKTRDASARIDAIEPELAEIQAAIDRLLLLFPAVPHASAPRGDSEADNVVIRSVGEMPTFDFEPKDHLALGEYLGILDFPRAAKVAGSGFALYRGAGAELRRALISWMLDFHIREHGYREVHPPALVSEASMRNAGKLPKFAVDSYRTEPDGLWLSPTVEVALAAMHGDEVLDGVLLPIKYVAYTPAFRREAGAAGTETRGLRRLHQFDKVELFNFTDPGSSYDDLEVMLRAAEHTAEALGLPYRVVEICTADLGFSASKQYDVEVWAAGIGDWLEVSSVSNCEAFQARRAGTRFRRPGESGTQHVHTLNGTGIALRTMIAILENYQREDGTVEVPAVLRPYLGDRERLEPEAGWP